MLSLIQTLSELMVPIYNAQVSLLTDLLLIAWLAGTCCAFTYWAYCAVHVLGLRKTELSDADVESMRWTRRMRTLLSRR